jgi:hypothetical protein
MKKIFGILKIIIFIFFLVIGVILFCLDLVVIITTFGYVKTSMANWITEKYVDLITKSPEDGKKEVA